MTVFTDAGRTTVIGKLTFYGMCVSFPEDFCICYGARQVACARLRGGVFSVDLVPDWDPGCINIVQRYFADTAKGSFDSAEERDYYLGIAAEAVMKTRNRWSGVPINAR